MSSFKDRAQAQKATARKPDARKTRRGAIERDHGPLLRLVAESAPKRPVQQARALATPLNAAQARYDVAMASKKLIFAIGPAGTGKTWLAATRAAEALKAGLIKSIIVTRPTIEAGASLGFLPGELEEKNEPYFRPVRDALAETLGSGPLEYFIKDGTIEARPLAYLRGATFKDAWIILDEAQNTTPVEMKMFLTRIGENAKVIVDGDEGQKDIVGMSGLTDAVKRLEGHPDIEVVRFTTDDIVRSGLCHDIVIRYQD